MSEPKLADLSVKDRTEYISDMCVLAQHIKDLTIKLQIKKDLYNSIIENMSKTYEAKNADYGDSVGDTYNKFGDVSFLTRITDKYNRILSLSDKGECGEVTDEKLDDTILDLANYCVLWLVEREYKATPKSETLTEMTKTFLKSSYK